MIFRDYLPGDFGALCRIDQLCFPPGIAYPPQDLSYWIRQRGAFVVVAEDEAAGRIAGFTLARPERSDQGHIITLDVLPEYRRRGVGAGLMEQAHARLKRAGASSIHLETSVENAAGIAFYSKLGYQAAARLPRYYLDRIDAWLMIKQL